MSPSKVVEKSNTHFTLNHFYQKSCRLWGNVEKYCIAGKATDDNTSMAHALFMPDNLGYKHTLKLPLLLDTASLSKTRHEIFVVIFEKKSPFLMHLTMIWKSRKKKGRRNEQTRRQHACWGVGLMFSKLLIDSFGASLYRSHALPGGLCYRCRY